METYVEHSHPMKHTGRRRPAIAEMTQVLTFIAFLCQLNGIAEERMGNNFE